MINSKNFNSAEARSKISISFFPGESKNFSPLFSSGFEESREIELECKLEDELDGGGTTWIGFEIDEPEMEFGMDTEIELELEHEFSDSESQVSTLNF